MPLAKKIDMPATRITILPLLSQILPDSNTNGIISKLGIAESICISSSDTCEKILSKSPKIGVTANPGSEVMAEIDHIANKVNKGIVPCPVLIFIEHNISIKKHHICK